MSSPNPNPTKEDTDMANKPTSTKPNPAAPEEAESLAAPSTKLTPLEAAKIRHSDAHALEQQLAQDLEIAQRRYQRAQQQTAECLGLRMQLEQQMQQ